MKRRILFLFLSLCILLGLLPTMALAESEGTDETYGTDEAAIEIEDVDDLIALLDDTGNTSGAYRLSNDFTINTNELRKGAARGNSEYSFKGTLDGDGHTITVKAESAPAEGFAPLFDTLQGSVSNLKVVFEGNVKGTTIAYDIGYENNSDVLNLSNISVTVKGNILYGEHDYSQYYGSILQPPHNYGNWYILYGGDPKYLATGFAWYIWGASLSEITVNVTGNVGTEDQMDADATSTGFAYFAAKGGSVHSITYEDIAVDVAGNIQSYTDDGHASAYGFAVGTTDSTAGFSCNTLDELSHASVAAQNIIAGSQAGASSAIGFARYLQGYTHDCSVNVPGTIRAVNQEGDADEDVYGYMNGEAYAYGFMLNTGGWSIAGRRNFVNNTVKAGEITAKTTSDTYYGGAFASGFAHQMMNTASSVPDLTYNNNRVQVTGSISAEANKGDSVAAGFVTSSGRDYYDRPDHIFGNTVEVGGDICAKSAEADATAAGYAYKSSTHRRNCTVHVKGSIISESPVQSIAAGFVGLQSQDNYYFVKDCQITVDGDIRAERSGSDAGIGIAGGVVGKVMNYKYSVTVPVTISGNTVTLGGNLSAANEDDFHGLTGLIVGLNEQEDTTKAQIVLTGNQFIGKETLLPESTEDTLYTAFVGQTKLSAMKEYTDNSVLFTKPDGRQYSSPVKPIPDNTDPDYVMKWELTDIQEVIQEYTITYKLNGGTNHPDNPVKYTAETETFTLKAPTRDGYTFLGWTRDANSQPQKIMTIEKGTTGNLTFTTHWQEDSSDGGDGGGTQYSYTLRYDTNGGETIKSEAKSYSWTKKYEELPVPVRDGYTFDGWYLDSKLTVPVEDDVKVNRSTITLYASWSKDMSNPDNNGVSGWLNTRDHNAYLNGYGNGTFGPDNNMTRAQAAQMFYNLLLNKDVPVTVTFSDVPDDAWYATAVNTLASLGIVNGISNGQFAPDQLITRAQFTVIAMRFTNGTTNGENIFSDVSANDWFYNQVVGSIQYGWIAGYSDGTFRPNNTITRAEVTTIVNRMLGRSADEGYVNSFTTSLRQFTDLTDTHWAYYDIMEATNAHNYEKNGDREIWTGLR